LFFFCFLLIKTLLQLLTFEELTLRISQKNNFCNRKVWF
jgi:hypothetical protein